jgi:hypothetical protein
VNSIRTRLYSLLSLCGTFAALVLVPALAWAQTTLDTPRLELVSVGHGKARLRVTAGPSGTPAGFAVSWISAGDLAANGGVWPVYGSSSEVARVSFTGVPTHQTWGEPGRSFMLGPGASIDVEIGDLATETGVSGNTVGELASGLEWVFQVNARPTESAAASPYSPALAGVTTHQGHDCTYTQGYWKNHTSVWPVGSLVLGSVSYTKNQLLQILLSSVKGNGLVSLAHQLIAAKLNVAWGSNPMEAAAAIAAADAMIGARVVPPIGSGSLPPSDVSELTQLLDDYNNGVTGPGHCDAVPAKAGSWGRLKSLYR